VDELRTRLSNLKPKADSALLVEGATQEKDALMEEAKRIGEDYLALEKYVNLNYMVGGWVGVCVCVCVCGGVGWGDGWVGGGGDGCMCELLTWWCWADTGVWGWGVERGQSGACVLVEGPGTNQDKDGRCSYPRHALLADEFAATTRNPCAGRAQDPEEARQDAAPLPLPPVLHRAPASAALGAGEGMCVGGWVEWMGDRWVDGWMGWQAAAASHLCTACLCSCCCIIAFDHCCLNSRPTRASIHPSTHPCRNHPG